MPENVQAQNVKPSADRQPDKHRPLYHLLPEANWLNDPNGVIHWRGQYHVFYQYNPYGTSWGVMHWGHAVSADLVHWQHLPIALTPTPDSADQEGCWSGYAVDNDGVPTLIYTGIGDKAHQQQLPCLATSQDDLVVWEKYAGNPIIASPPPGKAVNGFRDHCVWRGQDGLWYQLIGTGYREGGGAVLLYRSPDLIQWEYLHPLYEGTTGGDLAAETWECPDFFSLGERQVLCISSTSLNEVIYWLGHTEEGRFKPDSPQFQLLDQGFYLYAPQSLRDEGGRRLMWGWLREGRSHEAMQTAGWAGVMTLPLLLSERPDDKIGIAFAPETASLRGEHFEATGQELDGEWWLDQIEGDCLEIIAEFEPGTAEFGLNLLATPDQAEQTRVTYDPARQELRADTTQASLDPTLPGEVKSAALPLADGETLQLHIFVDRSVIELIANGHTYFSRRVYPTRPDARRLGLFGQARLKQLKVWRVKPIW